MKMRAKLMVGSLVISAAACGGVETSEYDQELDATTEGLSADVNRQVAQARRATARYHNFQNAIDDGFVDTGLPCINGQGYHYILPSRLDTYNTNEPTALLYDTNFNLIALEWVTPVAAVNGVRPVLFGETYHGPVLDPPLYVLHVWAWRGNPNGIFADANPTISCD